MKFGFLEITVLFLYFKVDTLLTLVLVDNARHVYTCAFSPSVSIFLNQV